MARENRGKTPDGQPLDELGALSLSKRQAAMVSPHAPGIVHFS
jgi:hypothetical protein